MPPHYGTVDQPSNGSTDQPPDQESQPLLHHGSQKPITKRLRTHLNQDIDNKYGDFVLLLCYTITGLLDSSAVFIWGAFVSMQTGNTIYIGLGLSDPGSGTRWIKSAISLGFFCLGSFCFSRFHRYFSPRRRWVLAASFAFQMALIIASAIFVTFEATDVPKGKELQWRAVVPLAMIAFESSGQTVASRALKYNSLTSVVLTSIYCDLFSDPELFAGPTKNAERNRKIAAPLCLLLGALIGGFWSHSSIGLAGALWTGAGMKCAVVVAWLVWKPAEEEA